MGQKMGYVYILTDHTHTYLYIGVTSDLTHRLDQHRIGKASVYTRRYKVYKLVYYEAIFGMMNAIRREKQLKNWHRRWKQNLITMNNPNWDEIILSLS